MAMLLMPSLAETVYASEFGVSTYHPGLIDLFAGYLAPPGTTLVKTYFLYQDANATAFAQNGHVEAYSHSVTYTSALFAAHVTKLRVLGSYWGFGAIGQVRIATQIGWLLGRLADLPSAAHGHGRGVPAISSSFRSC